MLAQDRRNRGIKLNYPEAVAIISHAVIEAAREGKSHAQALEIGIHAIAPSDLMSGVSSLLHGISIEAVFDDGRRLVVVDYPTDLQDIRPGQVVRLTALPPQSHDNVVSLSVTNTSAIDISVTTHFHFFEVNPRLAFDRAASFGRHLFIPAGEHIDFPAGQTIDVKLIPIDGDRVVIGFAGLVDGPLDAPGALDRAMMRAQELGYLGDDAR